MAKPPTRPPAGADPPELNARQLPYIAGAADFARAFGAAPDTMAALETYAGLLRRWQKAVNLVAPASLGDLWHRHFADSAQLWELAPGARRWLDLGSGAGFPGLVIAILGANQGVHVLLVESSGRKCAFLAEVARATGAPVEIRNERIESLRLGRTVAPFDVVTARGLAPLNKLLRLAAPFFGSGTVGLFPKGRNARAEVETARAAWTFHVKLVQSRTDRHARVLELREPAPRD